MRKYVYLLTCPERFKIGYSAEPRNRRTALRCKTHLDLTLAAMIPGTRNLERQVLGFFRAYRLDGEWFQPEREIEDWFRGHRDFIDPGPPYYPNSKPQRLLDPNHWFCSAKRDKPDDWKGIKA